MSFFKKYVEYKSSARHPAGDVYRRFMDPNYLTPDVYYMMDEIRDRQILRKYDKSSGDSVYLGTYLILFKTTDLDRFCLIMKRIADEWRVPEELNDPSEQEENTYVIAQYYPGTHSRIYLKGLGEKAIERVVKKYEKRKRKKLPFGING